MFEPNPEASPENLNERRKFLRRALLLGLGQTAVFGALGTRLYNLQVTEGNRFALMADENRISVEIIAPQRGRILDRMGQVLAANVEGYRAVIVPALARDLRKVLQRFSQIEPLTADDVDRIVTRSRRQPPSIAIVLAVDLSWERLAEINLNAPLLPGVRTEAAGRRQYFAGAAMGPVLGYVGAVERRAMNDNPVLRLPGMRVGRAGVEQGLEDFLRGQNGSVTSEVDSRGRVIRIIDQADPRPGRDMALTIDAGLQTEVMEKLSAHRRASSVVIGVKTGEVLALASSPGFDPNAAAGGSDRQAWARLQASPDDPLNNRAIRGLYPPGSTFKMVTALAALHGGHVSVHEQLPCDGRFEYFGQTFRCWKRSGHESCDLHRALRESCDCYFYELARRTGIESIAAMARTLGLGVLHDSGIAQGKAGLVPDRDWKRGRFGRGWLNGETILAGIGQGYVLATPLQLAVMTARIASGLAIAPTLALRGTETSAVPALAVSNSALAVIRRGMTAVVNEDNGTGAHAQGEAETYLLAGKTGTSQVSQASRDTVQSDIPWDKRDHALFVCYAPAAAPRYAMATVVEHGGGGGAVAAPLSRAIMDLVMTRDPLAKAVAPVEQSGVQSGAQKPTSTQARQDG